MANRLASATSPYLRQHAHNPVHWQEWGPQALAEAKRRNVPILLSIGYAACHWCHVMAHESFEDAGVAAAINAQFVAIKVDREERPDLDAIYMSATTAMTGQGGWPMTCFLTPAGNPFFCGTYYPRAQFLEILGAVAQAWGERRDEVLDGGAHIAHSLRSLVLTSSMPLDAAALDAAAQTLAHTFDLRNGGFGTAPKFPPSMVVEFLLRHAARTGSEPAAHMAARTCEAMARGGLYDQLGGGFARYSVDAGWVVPHFEKMLYDNALLLRAYLHWWRASGSPLALRVVRECVEFLLRDLRTPGGGFASSLDADAAGVEGSSYVWSPSQLAEVLGMPDGGRAAALLGVTEGGTYEGGLSTARLVGEPPPEWADWRARLLAARDERPQPERDDKVITSWNGLAIAALAEAGALLGEPSWVAAAQECAEFLLDVHVVGAPAGRGELRLARASIGGHAGAALGVLDDYGNLAEGLLALHQATGEVRWLTTAGAILDAAITHFADGEGGFFDTANDAEQLFTRPRSLGDNAEPCGTSALAGALLTYSALTGTHREAALAALSTMGDVARRDPRFAGWALAVAEAAAAGPIQVAVVGSGAGAPGAPDTEELVRIARASHSPGLVLAAGPPDAPGQPLLANRPLINGQATAYVCRGFVCDLPRTDPAEVAAALGVDRPGH